MDWKGDVSNQTLAPSSEWTWAEMFTTADAEKEVDNNDLVDILYAVSMFIMGFTGILGNFMVIGAVFVHKKLRVVSNAFIVNLAVADLMICFIADTFGIVGIYTNGKIFKDNPIFCDFLGCICVTSCCCSLWSITAIALNRYICICHRLMYPVVYNKHTVPFMIAGLWILSFMIDVPALAGWGEHSYTEDILYCTYDFMSHYGYSVFLMIWQFGIPVILLTYSYIRILLFSRSIKKALRKMQESDLPPSGSSNIAITDLRLLRSVLVIWIVFCSLWSPYAALLLLRDVTNLPRSFFVFATGFAHLSSSTNSVIYGLTHQNFREGYLILLRKLKVCGTKKKPKTFRATSTPQKLSISQNMSMTRQTSLRSSQLQKTTPEIEIGNIDPVVEDQSDINSESNYTQSGAYIIYCRHNLNDIHDNGQSLFTQLNF
ncbi:melatonin receptor type 1B-like [Amphiura filiformis]|uniref:melatonin receptor type 1B-like n=1 Tax=Amphiura filiformis TaxID=82378 RepID=UPI003B21E4EE